MPRPGSSLRVAHAAHVCALGIWAGAIGMTAAAAAVIFPTLKQLAPRLPDYQRVPEEGHWLLAAGHVAFGIFSVADRVQVVCAVVTAVTSVFLARACSFAPSLTGRVRTVSVLAALLLVTYYLLVLQPRMTSHLHEHWRLSALGQVEDARVHEAAFRNDHPTSSRVLGALLLSTLTALVLGAGLPSVSPRRTKE